LRMRWPLFFLAVTCLLVATYFGLYGRTSYAGFSAEKVEMMENEFRALAETADQDTRLRAQVELELIAQERRRPLLMYGAGAAGVLLLAAGFFVRAGRTRSTRHEEDRLSAALGSPEVTLEGARNKAAALLGVAPNAPPAVIEAALRAQLEARDLSRLPGLAPDLQRLAKTQHEELIRARDLLLRSSGR
jgi:hypothetical protein